MPGGIGLANPQFPYKSYFDPIGEAAPSSYIYDVTTKNQFALRSFKDNVGNCFTDMVLMSDGADSTSTFRLLTNTPEGNAVERMAVTNTGVITGTSATYTGQVKAATVLATTSLTSASLTVTGDVQGTSASLGAIDGASLTVTGDVQGTSASLGAIDGASLTVTGDVQGTSASLGAIDGTSLTVSKNASVSNVTQTTPVMYKISLASVNDVNAVTSFTKRNIFGTGSIIRISNGGTYTITNENTITLPSKGYWRVTGNFVFTGAGARIVVAVKPEIEGTASGEIFVSDYIRNESGHTTSSTFMSSVYDFIGNKQLGFQFARYGGGSVDTEIIGAASFVLVEKL